MEELMKQIEELRGELGKLMDGQDNKLRLKISQELDKAILEYIERKDRGLD